MTLEEYQHRIKLLFAHGDMSFHLAKLLEESGELAKAINKNVSRDEIADEIADVMIAALIFSAEYNFHMPTIIEAKLKALEDDPKYRNFTPPRYRNA